jgi:hypothetical protein
VLRFDNPSSSDVAAFVCFYFTDSEERAPIEMLDCGMEAQLGQEGVPSED